MDSPTAWNVNDKSDHLIVNQNGLRVDYKRVVLLKENQKSQPFSRFTFCSLCEKFLHICDYLPFT